MRFRLLVTSLLLLINSMSLAQTTIRSSESLLSTELVAHLLTRGESGSPRDQFLLGQAYAKGLGVRQDLAQAFVWCRRAADRGDPGAITEIGRMYAEGLGVRPNYQQALMWFQRAAGDHDAPAQNNLGLMYFQGLGMRP